MDHSQRMSLPAPSSHIGEESMAMYFDFGSPPQQQGQRLLQSVPSSSTTSQDGQESTPRGGGIRVSLACIPCRSRHVKCGAEIPNCARCIQDDKPCFYAKSRRGMRDRSAPRKRASMRESGKVSPTIGTHNGYTSHPLTYPLGGSSSESFTGPPSDASPSPSSSSSRITGKHVDPRRLIDLYYSFFHKAHPFVLPRYYLQARLDSDPDSLKFLYPIIQYIGSLYAQEVASSNLKEVALSQLDSPSLPPNGFTVQALALMAIAVHSEDEFDHGRAILDKAIYMALEIRMHSRTFANMERDPVLAESWRRTYWSLYITDSMVAGIQHSPSFLLFSMEANVELPCDECDYDGIIPRPRTLSDYEARDFEDEETIFSSFTYLIDLCRITGSLLGIKTLHGKDVEPVVANSDAMLVNWRLHLPREKQGVVDRNEEFDELLFQAHNLFQLLLVFIHRPLSRLFHCPIEAITPCAPAPPLQNDPNGTESRSYWLHTKKTLDAAEALVDLYALPIPILQHSPLGICGITISTLANLSACAYLMQGAEWYRTRDRIRLGLGGLKRFGEVWSAARRTERETKKIARSVFALPRPGVKRAVSWDGVGTSHIEEHSNASGSSMPMANLPYEYPIIDQMALHEHGIHDGHGNLTGFEDLGGMDYLSMLDHTQIMDQVHH